MRNSSRKAAPRAGFTLIELLTVIAIIGILAAILIPVVGSVRESAKRGQCQSNIRQQLIAMHMFAEDRAGKPPGPDAPPGFKSEDIGYWYVLSGVNDNAPQDLYPEYSDTYEIFLCPSTSNVIRDTVRDRQGRLRHLATNSRDAADTDGGHSYEYFGVYSTREMAGITKTPTTVQGMETMTVLVLDGDDAGLQNCPDPINNHGIAGWNWGFADGHVEWVTRERTNEMAVRSYHVPRCP